MGQCSVHTALVVETLGIYLLSFLWWDLYCRAEALRIGKMKEVGWNIRALVRKDESRVLLFSMVVLGGWFFMYAYASVLLEAGQSFGDLEAMELFVVDLFQNIASMGLFGMYAGLAAPRGKDDEEPSYWQGVVYGSVVIIGALTLVEALVAFQWPLALPKLESFRSFGMVYGLIQGIALYLFIGRANDALITDQLEYRSPVGKGWPHWVISGLYLFGFLYAGFQSFFSELLSEKHQVFIPYLVLLALVFKFVLVLLWWLMMRSEGDALSPLENHLYETHRFNTEERKSYARNFLRKHVNPMYMKGSVKKKYLGLEFHGSSKEKLRALGFIQDPEGVLVTSVYPGGPAMRADIRAGDLIHTVRHQPVGESGALTTALGTTNDKELVHVTYSRATWSAPGVFFCEQLHCKVQVRNYAKLKHRRSAKLSKAYLGLEVIGNHHERGVRVKVKKRSEQVVGGQKGLPKDDPEIDIVGIQLGSDGPYFPILDRSTLRQAIANLLPGEQLIIHTPTGPIPWPRYGPCELGTTVHWQPTQETLTIRYDMINPTPELIERHQVHPVFNEVTYTGRSYQSWLDIISMDPAIGTDAPIADVHVLDSRDDLILSYAVTAGEWKVIDKWPIWDQVDGGEHHMVIILRDVHLLAASTHRGPRVGIYYSLSVIQSKKKEDTPGSNRPV